MIPLPPSHLELSIPHTSPISAIPTPRLVAPGPAHNSILLPVFDVPHSLIRRELKPEAHGLRHWLKSNYQIKLSVVSVPLGDDSNNIVIWRFPACIGD